MKRATYLFLLCLGVATFARARRWNELAATTRRQVAGRAGGQRGEPSRHLEHNGKRPVEDRPARPRLVVAGGVGRQGHSQFRGEPGRVRSAEEGALFRRRPTKALRGGPSVASVLPRRKVGHRFVGPHCARRAAADVDPFEKQLRVGNAGHRRAPCVCLLRQRRAVLPGYGWQRIWSQKWTPHKTRLGWGTAASPVLYKDRLYVVNDNEEESYLVCLNAATGEQISHVERNEKSNWATPFIWENELRPPKSSRPAPARSAPMTSMATCCTNSVACPASRLPCPTPKTACCTSFRAT